MATDRIEREIVIDAPMEVVWAVVTEPEHISRWFSDFVELDLRAGGRAALTWNDHGTFQGRVERVEAPHFFSFRWVVDIGEDLTVHNSTLVEFSLSAEGDATRLTVVESGFADLARPADEQQRHADEHRRGWELELGHLEQYLARRAGAQGDR